jgi:hypothetical protein
MIPLQARDDRAIGRGKAKTGHLGRRYPAHGVVNPGTQLPGFDFGLVDQQANRQVIVVIFSLIEKRADPGLNTEFL